jgi:hypothetical protein
MYKMDLSKIRDVPGIRGYFKAGDSYCAVGKIMKACDIPVPQIVDNFYHFSPEASKFWNDLKSAGVDWTAIWAINDNFERNFQENHEKAVDKAIIAVLQSGKVELIKEKECVNA